MNGETWKDGFIAGLVIGAFIMAALMVVFGS